jgi:putative tricarboxylic transport membrane protein
MGLSDPTSPRAGSSGVIWGAAFLLLLGLAVVWGSTQLGFWVNLGPGPGFFPLILGVLLILLSAVWTLQARTPERHAPAAEDEGLHASDVPGEQTHADHPPDVPFKRVAAIVASLVLLAVGMDLLGFQLSMLIFLVFHLRVLGRRRWLLTAIVSVIGSFGVFSLFTMLLSVGLPAASIPFLRALGF